MSDSINREKTLDIINKLPKRGAEGGGVYVRINDVFDAVESLPSVDRPNGDLISRQDAIDALRESPYCYNDWINIENIIESLPSEDRSKGHIVTNRNGTFYPTVWAECSECGKPIDAWDKFCRHCGADMRSK